MFYGLVTVILLLPYSIIAEDELVFVHIIYRHGDRTPVSPYPNDPYKNNSYWPVEFGQLTNIGKQQHFELGQWFRKRYSDFLPEKYSLNDIYVRSTDVDRTYMSAESNLAGLYTPTGTDVWNIDIKWQPIPIHSVPEKSDAVLSAKKPCRNYDYELSKLLNNDNFKQLNLELQPLYEYVSNMTGKKIQDIQELEYLYNTLYIEELYKFPLPEWTKGVYPQKLLPVAHLSFKLYCFTPTLQRFKVGLLFHEITQRMVNKTKGTLKPDRKMWVYSAHDTTIANVLMALGAFEPHCPPYTSTIIFELRRTQGQDYYVNAFYKNDTVPQPISISGCDFRCPLPEVLRLLEPISVTEEEWETECNKTNNWPLFLFCLFVISVFISIYGIFQLLAIFCDRGYNCRRRRGSYQHLSDQIN